MTTVVQAQFEIHKAGQRSVLAAYRNEDLYQDALASLKEKRSGGKPTPREELRVK